MDVRKDGTEFPSFLSGSRLKDKTGKDVAVIRVIRDISDRKRLEEALERLSYLDGLTGIPNRRNFDQVFQLEWKRALRNQSPISLIMVDVDYFKGYNDLYGHQAGDACLKQVADIINSSLKRPADLAARYGGEEFIILLSETDVEGALLFAESLRTKIEALEIEHKGSSVSSYVTVSAGISSVLPGHDSTPDLLLSTADQALYQSKNKGRNRVQSKALQS